MGYFEDYYNNQEKEKQITKNKEFLCRYNKDLALIKEIIPNIVAKIKNNPPSNPEWVNINGKRVISWNVGWVSVMWDDTRHINILPDGTLIRATTSYSSEYNVVSMIPIKEGCLSDIYQKNDHFNPTELLQILADHTLKNFGVKASRSWGLKKYKRKPWLHN